MRYALLLVIGVLWCEPNAKQNGNPKSEQSIYREMTPAEYCKLASKLRADHILLAELQLDDIDSSRDWTKFTPAAKAKARAPWEKELKARKAARLMPHNHKHPMSVDIGEVFTHVPNNPKKTANIDWQFLEEIDKKTIMAHYKVKSSRSNSGEIQDGVLYGVPENAYKKVTRWQPIEIAGMWQRLDDLHTDAIPIKRFSRWPHEGEARKLWIEELNMESDDSKLPKK
ncbi:MAG: hypothetical protein V4719_20375 [Planctomycetota bacterium]